MKKIFFASDFHLGVDARHPSRVREQRLVRWLDQIAPEAEVVYLVGDLFEFWFEYGRVIPKGFSRFLGKLAELRDAGIRIEVFTGNHDLWMFGYFEAEFGIPVHRRPIQVEYGGKHFFIGHGDGLGPNDKGYKLLKKVFTHPLNQWLFRWLHPDLGMRLAGVSSEASRRSMPEEERSWMGEPHEWLLQYCNRKIDQGIEPDYFVFGHRHLVVDWLLKNGRSRYINLGDWMSFYSYAVFDGADLQVLFFENEGHMVKNDSAD